MSFAEVVLANPTPRLERIYHYIVPDILSEKAVIGSQVLVPFGNGERVAYIVGFKDKADVPNVKEIKELLSPAPLFTGNSLKLAKWISEYYCSFFITALRAVMPPGTKQRESRKKPAKAARLSTPDVSPDATATASPRFKLTEGQEKAVSVLADQLDKEKGEVFLLYGPAGSGKTEVYLQIVERALSKGLGSIVLVPEISLTPQLVRRFRDRFEDHISILHSGLTDRERRISWEKVSSGENKIVLGTRSAIFAPVQNLKVVVLDEEFETTYKQDQNPRYHARRVAEFLSKEFGALTILGSATPSVETYHKAQTGEYSLIPLPARISPFPLPSVRIIDMRNEKRNLLSPALRKEIKETLEKDEKIILFTNRTGFFTYAMCRECGKGIECPHCAVSLVYHFKSNELACGHCGFRTGIDIVCPNCRSSDIGFMGIGTQRIEEEVAEIYRKAKIVRLDRFSTTARGSHEKMFAAFAEGEANVLIGSQMVVKGLDVARVTLVGVVSADSMLNVPDFRAAEKTFVGLMQVAGRAGRMDLPGRVIVQTHNPDHYSIRLAASYDMDSFYKEELGQREELGYPPFTSLINVVVSSKEDKKAANAASDLKKLLSGTDALGPAKAPIAKLRGEFRHQVILRGKDMDALRISLDSALSRLARPFDVRIAVDIDPVNLL